MPSLRAELILFHSSTLGVFGWKNVQDKTVGGPFPKYLFIRKSNKNIIFGECSWNGSLGVLCTFFALRMQAFSCTRAVGMENLWEKPQVLLKCWIHHIKSLIILKTSSINTQKDHFLCALNGCHRSSLETNISGTNLAALKFTHLWL